MFTVIWSPSASGEYAGFILTSIDRAIEIENAGYDINDKLEVNPTGYGQHIREGIWRISSGPIVAIYSIEDKTVTIDGLGWIG